MILGRPATLANDLRITRVGESVLVRLSIYADHSRDNVGARVSIEPRFLPNGRLGRLAGVPIPPVGRHGTGVIVRNQDSQFNS